MPDSMNTSKTPKEKRNSAQLVDDTIMAGVNSGVRVWNWTTGRTKADLANMMLTGSAIGLGLGACLFTGEKAVNPLGKGAVLVVGAGGCFVAHMFQRGNIKIEELEGKAMEDSAMSLRAEEMKGEMGVTGCGLSLIAGTGLVMASAGSDLPLEAIHSGFLAMGVSCYVMRADTVPPRKNALARGLDMTRDLLRKVRVEPVALPLRVRV